MITALPFLSVVFASLRIPLPAAVTCAVDIIIIPMQGRCRGVRGFPEHVATHGLWEHVFSGPGHVVLRS